MPWFSKNQKASPPAYFTIGSHQPTTTLDRSTICRMAFTILITLLEKYGPESFAKIMDSLYIGFSKSGPVVTDLSVMRQQQNLVGHAKLSEIPAIMKAKGKVMYYGNIITAENAEMLLQQDFMQAAEEIASKIL